jgi:hypothetical protein
MGDRIMKQMLNTILTNAEDAHYLIAQLEDLMFSIRFGIEKIQEEITMFDFIIDNLNKIKDEVINGSEIALETIGKIVDDTLEGTKKGLDSIKSLEDEPKDK